MLPFVSLVTVLMIFHTIFIDSEATAEKVSTSSVVSDHQDSVVGAFAGAVVLNDSTKVVLPAHSIHNRSQGTLLHQVTHHGLFLTAKGGQQDRLVLTQQNWLCVEATLLSYYHVKVPLRRRVLEFIHATGKKWLEFNNSMGQFWHPPLLLTYPLSELISNQLLHLILTAALLQYVSTGLSLWG